MTETIGLLAGSGDLPALVARACQAQGHRLYISQLAPVSPELEKFDGDQIGLGQVGKRLAALRKARVGKLVIAGYVSRPDFSDLKLDWKGARLLPKVMKAARAGDAGLMRFLVEQLEAEGFEIIGAEAFLTPFLIEQGNYTEVEPGDSSQADIEKAAQIAAHCGALDIGQGAVVANGLVLAVEAQEGTDAMLERVFDLPEAIRGNQTKRAGVLVKRPKPGQETRVDLPVIGASTVQLAAKAGLAGIVLQARGGFFLSVTNPLFMHRTMECSFVVRNFNLSMA